MPKAHLEISEAELIERAFIRFMRIKLREAKLDEILAQDKVKAMIAAEREALMMTDEERKNSTRRYLRGIAERERCSVEEVAKLFPKLVKELGGVL